MIASGPPDVLRINVAELVSDSNSTTVNKEQQQHTTPPLQPPPHNEEDENDSHQILTFESNVTGEYVLCVSSRYVVVVTCNKEMDWTPVGVCQRPSFGCQALRAQAGWNTDSSSFVVCNSLGIAEFYDVAPHEGGKNGMQALRLSLPSWVIGAQTETRSGSMLRVSYRCSINSTVDGEQVSLYSVLVNRMWLLMGTSKGSIVRVLWTGEIVKDKEVDVLGAEVTQGKRITQVELGYQQRVGFVSQGGIAGIMSKKDETVVKLADKGAVSISMHKVRSLTLVGFSTGKVQVHAVGTDQTELIREIRFPFDEVPDHLSRNTLCEAAQVTWSPDGSSFFAVGYSVGYLLWSFAGCKAVSLFISQEVSQKPFLPYFGWTLQGYNLVTNALQTYTITTDNTPKDAMILNSIQLVKSCSLSAQVVANNSSMCMQGWNYILSLQNQEWDVESLSWQRIDLPPLYINKNWPIRSVSASPDGDYLAVCGRQGAAVYCKSTKRWRLFNSVEEENNLHCMACFWLGDEVLCFVHREPRTRVWEILCFPRDSLELSNLLGKATLPGRPLAVDTAPDVLIFMLNDRLCMYRVSRLYDSATSQQADDTPIHTDSSGDEAEHHLNVNKPTTPSKQQAQKRFVIRRASASVKEPRLVDGVYIDHLETIKFTFQDIETPVSLCVMPVGATRRAGTDVKLPKCAVLTSRGYLYVVDTDEGMTSCISKRVFGIMPQSWQKIEQADDVVLAYLEKEVQEKEELVSSSVAAEEETPKLPAILLYSLWLVDENGGLRLWLPSLDIIGESIDTRCADMAFDVIPLGILESHGLVIGVTQRARMVTKFKTPCFEIAIRVTPTTHAVLQFVMKQGRTDLAAQVLVQASTHLPLFRETLDLFLFNVVEEDYKHRKEGDYVKLLPSTTSLLRTGKVAAIIDSRMYDAIVITCARKMESSRWDLFFQYAGNPEQIFNDATYIGDLNTAAGSMIVADYFSPEKSSRRIAALAHAAALKKDERLLQEIKHFQMTKLA